jgi:ABC-type transport system substrate-binding protein
MEVWNGADLNPLAYNGYVAPDTMMYTVYQSLTTVNGSALYQDGNVQVLPMLAVNWTASPNDTTYTFNLRQGVNFSNGDPFNAYQVWGQMYATYYLAANSSSFLNAYNVFNFTGVDFGPATLALMNQSGVVSPNSALLSVMENKSWPIYVTGPYQIVFQLQAPFIYFPETLPDFIGLLYDVQYVLQNGGFGNLTAVNPYFNLHPPPGTGPYVVTGVQSGSYVSFTQSTTYWGKNLTAAQIQANPYLDPGHVKNVIIYAKTDDLARYTDLSDGAAQISAVESANFPLVLANPSKYGVFRMPSNDMLFLGIAMNTHRYPTNITDFRQAVVHALNLTYINSEVFFGGLSSMVGPEYPSQTQYYDLGNLPPYSYNLTLAKQDLNASGVNVATLTPLEFRVVSGCTYCISTAQIVQGDLGQLGIPVNVEVTESSQFNLPYISGYGSYTQALADANQSAQLQWFGLSTFAPDAPTPADAWILFGNYNTPVNDYAVYANPTVQKCVNAWEDTSNASQIVQLCTAAQLQYYNDAPYIWLGSSTLVFGAGSVCYDKDVIKGFLLDPIFTGQTTSAIFNTVTFVNG